MYQVGFFLISTPRPSIIYLCKYQFDMRTLLMMLRLGTFFYISQLVISCFSFFKEPKIVFFLHFTTFLSDEMRERLRVKFKLDHVA